MAFEFVLTDGVTNINLVYDAAAQTAWRLQQGMSMGGEEVLVTLHQGDFEPPVPIMGTNPVRTGIFTVDIKPGTADGTLNKEAMLRRWIDGDDQQALRYHTTGDVRKIYLKVRNEGARNYTYHDVLWGNVNSAAAYYSNAAQVTQFAPSVVIQVYLEATGYGSIITLRNDLKNPSFDVATGGIGLNWGIDGSPTPTVGGGNYLIGGTSQRIVATAGNEGIHSDTVANPGAYDNALAYAWVYVASGTVSVQLYNVTGAAIEQSKTLDATDSGGNSDRSAKDEAGNTWYRVVVNGTFDPADEMRLRVWSSGGAATFYVDACYLEYNCTLEPEGWVSHKTIYNRADVTTSDPDRINYLDIWGIPGDALADVCYKVVAGASVVCSALILARGITPAIPLATIAVQNHWLESSDGTPAVVATGSWAQTSNAAYSGGSYRRFTASAGGGSGTVTWTISGDSARRFLKSVRAVWVQWGASSTTPTITFSCTVGAADYARAYTANPATTGSALHLTSLGILNGRGALPETVPDTSQPTLTFTLTIAAVPNAGTVDIDGVWLFYGDEDDYTVATMLSEIGNNDPVWIDGVNGGIINNDSGVFEPAVLGSKKWQVNPGQTQNRTLFLFPTNSSTFTTTITHDFTITTEVRPRTRHLLGTLGAIVP